MINTYEAYLGLVELIFGNVLRSSKHDLDVMPYFILPKLVCFESGTNSNFIIEVQKRIFYDDFIPIF